MHFTKILLSWYKLNHRDLPWRRTKDPYKIWVSEIIFQQTRIEQGLDYYLRFVDRFPGITELAGADEETVLKLWQGLGYYSRARNLHYSAQEILKNYSGQFPSAYEDILKLKGVGEYTAAAISSMAFGLPYPVVDGNVSRFFSRYFGVTEPVDGPSGKKTIYRFAHENLSMTEPGEFNQAIMEFGALICKPKSPNCQICPLQKKCFAYANGQVALLPVKALPSGRKSRFFNYLVFLFNDPKMGTTTFLRKRIGNDIWKNLYDFPLIESSRPLSQDKLVQTEEWNRLIENRAVVISGRSEKYQHVLTHQMIQTRFYFIHLKRNPFMTFNQVQLKNLNEYPAPRLIEKFLCGSLFRELSTQVKSGK